MVIHADSFYLDDDVDGTLQNRIKRLVVEGILSGRFRQGERMPSSRALAQHLGVSRITVTIAYTDLVADDYLVARGRSGYFVSDTAPAAPQFRPARGTGAGNRGGGLGAAIWRIAARPDGPDRPAALTGRSYPYPVHLRADRSVKLFDHQNWRLCALQALGQKDFDSADHGSVRA